MFKNLFKKKDTKSPEVPKVAPGPEKKSGGFFSKIKSKLGSGITSRIGKSAAQGEEILGVEITAHEIRLAQVTSNKANQWILEKFYIHKVDLPEDALVFENQDKLGSELQIALQKSKIATPNAASPAPRAPIAVTNGTADGAASAIPLINPPTPLPTPFPRLPNALPTPPNMHSPLLLFRFL